MSHPLISGCSCGYEMAGPLVIRTQSCPVCSALVLHHMDDLQSQLTLFPGGTTLSASDSGGALNDLNHLDSAIRNIRDRQDPLDDLPF